MSAPNSAPDGLKGRVAIVTGAAGGIGSRVVQRLADEGVAVAALDKVSTDVIRERIGRSGIMEVQCDVTDSGQVEKAFAGVRRQLGPVEVLVLCAGVSQNTHLLDITDEEWDDIFAANVKSVHYCVKTAYAGLVEQGYGKIVCLGSISGKQGGVKAGPHYIAAKGAVHAYIKWVAKEGARHGIYINAVAPGPVQTAMWAGLNAGKSVEATGVPLNRYGTPDDIAEAVLFLASSQSNWITGSVLDVNGGMLMA